MTRSLYIIILLSFHLCIIAQVEKYHHIPSPLPPSTFQFIKSGEIPVSEYTGLPEISIPIYTISSDEINIPIVLQYHSGGIKVSDEAPWVGLGWNIQFGNVTQIINDRDDFGNFTKVLPDYYDGHSPGFEFPWKYMWPNNSLNPVGWGISTGISYSAPNSSFIIFTDFYIPINKNYSRYPQLFNVETLSGDDIIDSEPDVFKANFLNHYLEFIKDFSTGEYIVINQSNYKIKSTINTLGELFWEITAPNGIKFLFEELNEIKNDLTYSRVNTSVYSNGESLVKNRIWLLTKVITTKKKEISFIYSKTSEIQELVSISQTDRYFKSISQSSESCNFPPKKVMNAYGSEGLNTGINHDYSIFRSKPIVQSYINSITFQEGEIIFTKSTRIDRAGDLRLDKISVFNINNDLVNQIDLYYSYFNSFLSDHTLNHDYEDYYTSKTSDELNKRLKLDSIKFNSEQVYAFSYDLTPLPSKTSYATDYWGYYNGQINNVSLIANPDHIGKQILGDNGNDHRPYLSFAKAGILTQIKYPTGGRTVFDYEFNTFNRPIYSDITIGAGLRIRSLINLDGEVIKSRKEYLYDNGLMMIPMKLWGNGSFTTCNPSTGSGSFSFNSYTCEYVSGNNFYTSALFGSGQYIGYDMVTSINFDELNQNNGKTISVFYNNQDIGFNAYEEKSQMTLPSQKTHTAPENGLLKTKTILDSNGDTILWQSYNYEFKLSPLFYGAKISFYNYLVSAYPILTSDCIYQVTHQNIVGFYPIFSKQSLLKTIETKEFTPIGYIYSKQTNNYNSYNLPSCSNMKNSEGEILYECFSYPMDSEEPFMEALVQKNVINHPISISRFNNGTTIYSLKENYSDFGGLTLVNKISERFNGSSAFKEILFDNYDISNGNLLQYHKANDITYSYIWCYNRTYPVIKAENVDYNILNTAVTSIQSNLQSFLISTIGDLTNTAQKNAWKTFNTSLRNHSSLNKAHITTYTYKPLIGMTSETDPNGVTTFYEYDGFGRLKLIKDDNDNILKTFEYHYKQ